MQTEKRARTASSPRILRTVRPGAPGTMGLLDEYGDKLVCVRYRYDEKEGRCYTTAEITVRTSPWTPPKRGPKPDDLVWVKIEWGERELAGRVKAAGGRWNPERKRWELPWARAVELGVELRVEGRVGFQK